MVNSGQVMPRGARPFAWALFLFGAAALPGGAAGTCTENFTETGEWSSGKVFRTFVEIPATERDAGLVRLAQHLASQGFLGVDAKKELGIASAYQENNGKKSTVNAVLSDATPGVVRAEVSFRLANGLRTSGSLMRTELCKWLAAAFPQTASSPGESGVTLLRPSGEAASLEITIGQSREAGGGLALLYFFDFPGDRAAVRAPGSPALRVRAAKNPTATHQLVRCDSDTEEGRRSVKVGSAGSLLKLGFTGKGDLAPDKDWTVPFRAEPDGDGFWKITPTKPLPPGEYGLWEVESYSVALFGVDGP